MKHKMNNMKGVSALPTILLLSAVILETVVGGLAVAYFFSNSLLSEQLSIEALKAAESGAHDAISRVNDHINCPDSTTYNDASAKCPSLYKFTVNGDRTVCVSIGNVSGGEMTIRSRGSAFTRRKTIETVLGMDVLGTATTSATVEVQSFKEIATPAGVFTNCDAP